MRILVVDDDEAVRHWLDHALRRDGYQVVLAASGADALSAHAESPPDALVLDPHPSPTAAR